MRGDSGPGCGSPSPTVARERCSAEFTEATVVPRVCAVSSALNARTSRSSSTARWFGDSSCRAVAHASVMFSRARSLSSGVGAGLDQSIASGSGSSHASARSFKAVRGSPAGAPKPWGRTRLEADDSALRQVLVAIRYIQVRTEDRPSKSWKARQARRYVSCTWSSASTGDPIIR